MVEKLEPKIPLHKRPSRLPRRPRPMEKMETKPAKSIETNYPNTKSIQNISPNELTTSSIKSAMAGVQPNMDKTKSKYEFWQWLKLARAINKLKADISLKIGALQERVAMNGEISELIQELKVASEDLNALTLQMSYVDEEMAKDLENP